MIQYDVVGMKKLIVILVLLLVAAGAAIWYLKFAGVTHEDIYDAVTAESATFS